MAQAIEIEWTDATWNPVTGCTKIGPGCDNCYASRFAERWRGIEGHPYEQGFDLRLWPNRDRRCLKCDRKKFCDARPYGTPVVSYTVHGSTVFNPAASNGAVSRVATIMALAAAVAAM